MHKKLVVFLILSALVLIPDFLNIENDHIACAAAKTSLLAGISKVNITPKIPIPMSGYGSRKEPFKGIHDDLFARIVVFSDGEKKAALVTADVIGFSHSFWEETTNSIESQTGIPRENILLSAVHNHAGPVTRVYVRSDSPEVLAYVDELKKKIISAVKDACSNLQQVSIGAGIGECKMNINRRAPDGKGNITLGRNPYGACDHEVGVVRLDDRKGNPVSIIINWPCHGTVLGPRNYLISGDWPGAVSGYVENHFGSTFITPVTAGASGDINAIYGPHIDFVDVKSYSYGIDAIGADLGEEVIRVARDIKVMPGGSISTSQRVINLPRKKEETKLLQPDYKSGKFVDVRLSALKIGSIVFAGVSGEVFNEIGVRLKKQSPYKYTFMITHCNGSSGYLITDKAYHEGGYEARSTRAESGAEKAIIENLLEMISDL